jgi:hypothetical protein
MFVHTMLPRIAALQLCTGKVERVFKTGVKETRWASGSWRGIVETSSGTLLTERPIY